MSSHSIVAEKSFHFAVRIVRLCNFLSDKKHEKVISKQILRSGTSIGANIEEALGCRTDANFAYRIYIAYKEARETHYWLRILIETEYISDEESQTILAECSELLKMLSAITKSMQDKTLTK